MRLIALIVNGVAHGFSINGQAFVLLAIGLVPALECAVEMDGVHTDEHITDDGQARYDVVLILESAGEPSSGLLPKAFSPIRDGQIAAHSTQGRTGGNS